MDLAKLLVSVIRGTIFNSLPLMSVWIEYSILSNINIAHYYYDVINKIHKVSLTWYNHAKVNIKKKKKVSHFRIRFPFRKRQYSFISHMVWDMMNLTCHLFFWVCSGFKPLQRTSRILNQYKFNLTYCKQSTWSHNGLLHFWKFWLHFILCLLRYLWCPREINMCCDYWF